MHRILALGDDAIVTTEAGSDYRTVVNPDYRYPVPGIVTILATRRRRDVAGIFTFSKSAVMTTDTIAGGVDMIKFPAQCNVAGIADITARYMSRILALGGNPIVAARTATADRGVIDPDNVGP